MPSWIMTLVSLLTGLIPLATKIGALWEGSAGFGKIADLLASASPTLLKTLQQVGAAMFPSVDAQAQKVLAAIHLGYPEATKWVQASLNAIQATGYIHYGDPLVIDGDFGPKTFAAVVTLQAKLGLKATGAVTAAEYEAINKLLVSPKTV